MQDYDPDTLCAVLTVAITEDGSFAPQLTKLSSMLEQAKLKGLPPPYTDYTEILIYELFPPILEKILDVATLKTNEELATVNFIKTSIGIIIWTFSTKKNYKLISYLGKIFDPSQLIYTYNGRKQDSPYSTLLMDFANHAKSKFLPTFLFGLLSKNDLQINDFVCVFDILRRLSSYLGSNVVFSKVEQQSQTISTAIHNQIQVDNDRNLNHKQIITIFDYIFECTINPIIISCALAVIHRFLKSEIAEVKMSGFRLAQIIFGKVMSGTSQLSPEEIELLSLIINSAQTLESFEVIKPIFTNFASHGTLSNELVHKLYNAVNSQHISIVPQCQNIFADIALQMKNPDVILDIPDLAPAIQGRLLEGHQYARTVSILLWSKVKDDPSLIEILTRTASKTDLGDLLQQAVELAKEKEFTAKIISFIDAVLSNTKAVFFPSPLINACIESEINQEIVTKLVSIVSKSHAFFSSEQIQTIFVHLSDEFKCTFFSMILPENGFCLCGEDSYDAIVNIINNTDKSTIGILKHSYLNIKDSAADPVLIARVIEAAYEKLWAQAMNDDEEARQLLLSVKEKSDLPQTLARLTERALKCIKEHPHEALVICNECLKVANDHISPLSLGFKQHKVSFDNELVTIKVTSQVKNFTVQCLKHESIATLKPLIAKELDIEEAAVIIYHNKSALKNGFIRDLDPLEIEARILNEYSASAHFTKENHPISILLSHINELLDLLKSNFALDALNVLEQLPTPHDYSIQQLIFNEPYIYLYQIQYVFSNQEKCAEIIPTVREIFENNFDSLLPDSRLISLKLIKDGTEKLIDTLVKLVEIPNDSLFDQLSSMLIDLIKNFETKISKENLVKLIFDNRRNFVQKLLETKLIKSQPFEEIWNIFIAREDKLAHVYIFCHLPVDLVYASEFESILRSFNTTEKEVLLCLADLCERWPEFPINSYDDFMIDNYVKCINKDVCIVAAPFSLIKSMMDRSQQFKEKVINLFGVNFPSNAPWGYAPLDESRNADTNRCGLNNLGATCYINSTLQVLFSIEPFRNFIISTEFEDEGLKALRVLFTKMQYSDSKFVDMHEFASHWKDWDNQPINPREQQDAHDFLLQLFLKLETYPISSLFSGETASHFRGVKNDFHTSNTDTFNSLQFPIKNIKTIEDSLRIFFAPETINEYRSEQYPEPFTVERYTTIERLPPYLIVQLKRFDFSLETGMRFKIDTEFDVPDTFTINDSKFKLIGVVVHQGDADVGHYFSYSKTDKWSVFNDIAASNSSVEEAVSTINAVREYGTSAYLCFYVNENAEAVEKYELVPDQQILDSIIKDNKRLIQDRVYFSNEFVNFVCELIDKQDCHKIIVNYLMYVLSHSANADNFEKLVNKVIEQFDNGMFETLKELFDVNGTEVIKDILVQSTVPRIRSALAHLLKEIFKRLPLDNEMIIVLMAMLMEYSHDILANWRNSFDIFMIFEVFSEIDQEHAQHLYSLDIDSLLINFVTQSIPHFVKDKANGASADRFKRISDPSHIINTLVNMQVPERVFTPSFMKWIISSEKIGDSIINLIQKLKVKNVEKFIDCGSPISEELIISLCEKTTFIVPRGWLEKGSLATPEAYGRMARALMNIENLEQFATKNYELMAALLLCQNTVISGDCIEAMKKKATENAVKAYSRFVSFVPPLSKRRYHGVSVNAAGSFDDFPGFRFLNALRELIENNPIGADIPLYTKALQDTAAIGGKFDAHTICLIELACTAAVLANSDGKDLENLLDIVRKSFDIVDQKISHREYAIKAYISALKYAVEKTKLGIDAILPESASNIVAEVITSNKAPSAVSAVVELAQECSKRYANASRLYKIILFNLSKGTTPQLFHILTFFKNDCVQANGTYLFGKTESIKTLLVGATELSPSEHYFEQSMNFVQSMVYHATNQVADIMLKDPKIVTKYFTLAKNAKRGRNSVIKILMYIFEFAKDDLPSLFTNVGILGGELTDKERDEWISSLLLLILKLWMDTPPPPELLKHLGLEMSEHFKKTKTFADIRATLNILIEVNKNITRPANLAPLFATLDEQKVLDKPWRLEPMPNAPLDGLFAFTMTIAMNTHDQKQKESMLKAAEMWPDEPWHAKLASELKKH